MQHYRHQGQRVPGGKQQNFAGSVCAKNAQFVYFSASKIINECSSTFELVIVLKIKNQLIMSLNHIIYCRSGQANAPARRAKSSKYAEMRLLHEAFQYLLKRKALQVKLFY